MTTLPSLEPLLPANCLQNPAAQGTGKKQRHPSKIYEEGQQSPRVQQFFLDHPVNDKGL